MTVSQLQPASGAPVPLPPPDPALPGLARLLDVRRAAELLARSLGHHPDSVEIATVRYKPARRLVVEYDVTSSGRMYSAVALLDRKADLHALSSPAGVFWEPDACALVQWYPVDVGLPALALTPRELALGLRAEGVEVAVTEARRLGYKPFERATLQLGDRVVKLYRSSSKLASATAALEDLTRNGIPCAPLQGISKRLSTTVQAFVAGTTPNILAAAAAAAALVRRLHELNPSGLEPVGAQRRLDPAARTAAVVGAIAPKLLSRVEALVAGLKDELPHLDAAVPSHGDFEPGQLIESDELLLVDLDDYCATTPADDLGWYSAHAARGRDADPTAVEEVVEALVAGYGSRPRDLQWYVAASILARAAFPFRCQDPSWPERIERLVSAAEAARRAA